MLAGSKDLHGKGQEVRRTYKAMFPLGCLMIAALCLAQWFSTCALQHFERTENNPLTGVSSDSLYIRYLHYNSLE